MSWGISAAGSTGDEAGLLERAKAFFAGLKADHGLVDLTVTTGSAGGLTHDALPAEDVAAGDPFPGSGPESAPPADPEPDTEPPGEVETSPDPTVGGKK